MYVCLCIVIIIIIVITNTMAVVVSTKGWAEKAPPRPHFLVPMCIIR